MTLVDVYYLHYVKCNGPSGKFVHLQQHKVLILSIRFVGVITNCDTPKPSLHDTNTMRSIVAIIKGTHTIQDWP